MTYARHILRRCNPLKAGIKWDPVWRKADKEKGSKYKLLINVDVSPSTQAWIFSLLSALSLADKRTERSANGPYII